MISYKEQHLAPCTKIVGQAYLLHLTGYTVICMLMHLVPTFGWLFFKAGKSKQVCDMQALGILKVEPSTISNSLFFANKLNTSLKNQVALYIQ